MLRLGAMLEALHTQDVEEARRTPPEIKARQALALMDDGLRLKRIALRQRHPELADEAIEERLLRWLRRED